MIRTFVDALPQSIEQSIMRNEKNKTIRWWMYHKKHNTMKAFSFSSILKNFGKQLSSLASQMPWCNLRFNLGSMSVLSRVNPLFSRTSFGTSFGTSRRASRFAAILTILFTIGVGSVWGETITMSSIFTGKNTSATITSPLNATVSTTASASNATDSKLGSDNNYFQIVLTDKTFSAASINGYINSTDKTKNWGFQFTTNGGTTWGSEVTQANDGTKSAHDINVGVTIPSGANGIRIIRKAGTSTYVYSVTLTTTSGGVTSHSVSAVTSTGTNTYGTVSAAASSVAEGGTTTITAVPASGFRVTNWAVSGTGASINPSGASNANSTTLTMGTADATVTVTFGAIPTHSISYTNLKGADNSANPTTYTEGVGVASFAKLRHVVGYDFTGWSPSSISSSATTDQTIDAQWTARAAAAGTGTLTYALAFGTSTITTSSITRNNGALYDATDVSIAHTSFNDGAAKNGCSGKLTTTSAKDASNYVELTFKIADGYTFTPTEVQVRGNAVSTAKTMEVELKDNSATPNTKSVSGSLAEGSTSGGSTVTLDFDASGTVTLEGTVTLKIFVYGATNHWRLGTSIIVNGTVASAAPSCTAPTNVAISGEYIRFPGETLTLTVSGENITGDATYTWKKGDQVLAGQTTATLTINNATITDAGNYTCTVSNGDGCEATANYTVKMYSLRGLIDWSTDCAFTKVNATTATYSMELTGSSSYEFKIFDGSAYYGNEGDNPTMTSSNCTNWPMKENSGNNVTLQTTVTGTYTFTLNYADASNLTISVTYPQKKTIYLNPGVWADANPIYAVHAWNDGGGFKDLLMELDCGNLWKVEVDVNYDKIIFIRGNNSYNISNPWGNVWNQTGDLTIDNVQYNIGAEWDFSQASWTSYTPSTFTISFDANEGTGTTASVTNIACGSNATLTANAFTRTGYTFAGWATTANGEVAYADKATINNITSNITLYAQWAEQLTLTSLECDVLYKVEDMVPSGITLSATGQYASGLSSNTKFEVIGNAAQTSNEAGTPEMKNGAATISEVSFTNALYFKNQANLSGKIPTSRAIKFQIDNTGTLDIYCKGPGSIYLVREGGTGSAIGTGNDNAKVTVNNIIAGTYYLYATAGSRTLFGIQLNCLTTYTVTYNLGGGSGTTPTQEATAEGGTFTLAAATGITKDGYTFTGWNDGTNTYEAGATYTMPAQNVTLTAQWTAVSTYAVTVTPPTNGTVTASKTTGINEGETITLTVTPASGYQLETLTVKDASDNTVTVTDNQFTMPASNVTVSATFTAVPAGGGDCEISYTFDDLDGWTIDKTKDAYECAIKSSKYQDIAIVNGNMLGVGITGSSGSVTITTTSVITDITNITFKLASTDTSNPTIVVSLVDGSTITQLASVTPKTANKTSAKSNKDWGEHSIDLEKKSGKIRIEFKATSSGKYATLDDLVITRICCTAPATPLAVSVDNDEITVGGIATITTTGGNGSAVTLTANGGTIEGNTYTAPATPGTYTITATQPKNGEQCAGEATCTITVTDLPNAQVYDLALNTDNVCAGENATLTLNGSQSGVNYQLFKDGVASGTPVVGTGNALTWTVNETATYTVKSVANATYKETTMNGTPKLTVSNTPTITITGQGTVTQGEAVTLTATAAGATSFEWFSVDSETTTGGTSVATTATYTPDTDTEGTYYYYCVATNSCGSDRRCVAVVVKAPEGTCGTIPSTGASVTLTNGVILYSANSDGRQVDTDYIKEQDVNGDSNEEYAYNSSRYVLQMQADVERLIVYAYREGSARDLNGVKISPTFGPNAEDVAYVNADYSYKTSGSQLNYIYEITFNTPVTAGQYVFLDFSGSMYFWQICYVSSCEDLVPTVTPRAAVLCDEGSVTLTATNYTTNATLQWYKDGVAITGATTDTYTASEVGVYTFGANKTCERTSNEVAVVAAQTPVIETQPTNASTATGVTNSDIFVKATGATSYQWYTCDEDGGNPVIIAGQTAATLNVTHELPGTYYYKVVVIGGCDLSVTSNVASLEVVDGACFSMVVKKVSGVTLNNEEQMTETMADITGGTVVADGSNMSFNQYSVPNENRYLPEIILKNYLKVTLASGSIGKGTVIRVVYRNGSSGSGRGVQILKTDETVIHSFTNKTSTLTEETYEVTADMDVSEFYIGRATSNTTYLSEVEILGCVTPCEKPIITTQPVGNNYCNDTEWNNRESLSVTVAPVTDGGTLSYQWYKDGEEIDGATSSTYEPDESGQYYCIVTNTLEGNTASTTSNEVTVFNQQQNVTLTWNFKTGNRPHATQNSTTSLISNLTDITATGVNVSSDAKGDRTVKFGTVADPNNETDGATFSFDVEELYDFTPSTISMKVATVSTTFPIRVTIKDEIGQTITGQVTPAAADKETDVNFTMPIVKWMGKVTVLVQGNASGAEFRLFGDVTISGVVECGCTPPVMAWKQGETEVTEITVGYTAANFYEFPTLTNPGGLEVTYASTDENVATVDAMGVVTPRNNGTTVISAKYVGDANQGICPITVTYVLTIVCDDDQPMITTSVANPLDCNDEIPLQLVASDGVTPISSGFVQWYRNGVAIQGATEYTYEAGRTGTYTATLQINCLQTTSNSAVITNKQTEPTVTKLVSQQKIRNNGLEDGQRPYSSDLKYSLFEVTPTNTVDYTGPKWKATAMIHYQNGDLEDLGEVTWMREDATTATSITLGADFYEVSQVVLNKSLQKGDAIYVTVAPANACDTIDKYIMDSIPILVTDRYSLAYIITGTVAGGFFDVDAEPLADPVFTLLQDYYDVTAVNGYAPFSLNNYEPFDLVLLTDYPKTSSQKEYISALAGLVDEKPMLSFKAHMSGVAGWTEKGFLGNSVVPGCVNGEETNDSIDAQSHFHVLCYAHDMFQGVGLTDINGDGVVEELEILTGVAKDDKRWKGMQGFTASDASNFVNIAIIHDSQDEKSGSLVVACERQEVVDARFMMLSINNLATKYIGGDGTKVIANILEYLLHSDPTAVSDCSLVFDDNHGTGVWSDSLNWAPAYNMVPGRYHNVRIDRPCKVDQLAAVALVKVRKDTETTAKGQKGYWQGSLTVQPGKKLTVFGDFGKVQGKNFLDITPLQGNYNDLVIETDADEAGAFAIDPDANAQTDAPDATIKFYSQGTGAVAGSEDSSQALWHYMAIPTTGVQMAVTPFSGAWVCRWDEQVPNASNYPQAHWYVVHEEDQLMPFEGYALTQANPTTYTIKGRINVGNPTINTLTYTPVSGDNSGNRTDEQSRTYPKAYPGFNLLGNSYTAPIKLSEMPESAFSTNLQKTIYIYNAGTWAQWYGEGTPGSVVPEDGTSKTPGQYLALPLNANLGDGALKWIPAMQGFFVRVIGDGSATISGEKIDIDYLNMVVQPNYDDLETPPVPRAPQKPGKQKVDPNQSLMKMTVKGKRFADNLYLLIQDECSHEFDNGWDGDKIYGNARTPQLFAIEKYGPMAVNTVDDINGQSIGFFAGEDSEYTISYDPTEMREHYTQLYLHDMTTGTVTDMFAQNEYTFSVGKQGEVRRFVISTSPDPHWDTSDGGLLRAWAADEMLYVENFTDSEGDYTVFDAAGRRIAYGHLPALGRYSFQLKLIPGAYTVNVRTNSIVKPVKVIF